MARLFSGFASAARAGRQQAKQNEQNELNRMKIEAERALLDQQNAKLYKDGIDLTNAQNKMISRHFRASDKEEMQNIAIEAQNKLKLRLEEFGDDPQAFMKAGGVQLLKDYRDAILNSDKAQIIRNNHANLNKFSDLAKKSPTLVSQRDRRNKELWDANQIDAFPFSGQLREYKQPDDVTGYGSVGEAMIMDPANRAENFEAALYNYNIERRGPNDPIIGPTDVTDDELINFINNSNNVQMLPKYEDQLRGFTNRAKKASQQIILANDQIDRGYTGDWNDFWEQPTNRTALFNLKSRTNMGDFIKGDKNDNVYSANMFRGSEDLLMASILGVDEKEFNGSVERKTLENMIRTGEISMFDGDGNSISRGEGLPINQNVEVVGIRYAFEVQTDRDNFKSKLLTFEDIQEEGDGADLAKNKSKDGRIIVALKDKDFFSKDEYVYMKINMDQGLMADKFDKAVGEIDYRSKSVAETNPPRTFAYTPGKAFKFTGDNPVNAVNSLHFSTDESLKKIGVSEFDKGVYAVAMTHSLSMMDDEISPDQFMRALTTSEDPVWKEAREKLANKDADGYINTLVNRGKMSQGEADQLRLDMQKILQGYAVLSRQFDKQQVN